MVSLLLLALALTGSFTRHEFVSEYGSRSYWVYVPSSYDAKQSMPLVVMLHGCTQDGPDLARGSRLNDHAERRGFIVVYPEQPQSANPLKCWNWFDARHQQRAAGEPAILAGITKQVLEQYRIDTGRVFLGGISAGAAMANIVAVDYPELFAALALHAGIEYKAALTVLNARLAMSKGGPDPVRQGQLAFAAMAEHARFFPVFLANGEQDQSVPPLHVKQLAAQWLATYDLLGLKPAQSVVAEHHAVAPAYSYTVSKTYAEDGRLLTQTMLVSQLGHALSGGSPEGTYTDPNGPDAIAEMLGFFFAAVK